MANRERENRISEICEAFAEQLRSQGDGQFSRWVAENPDLAPDLTLRLKTILAVWRAARDQADEAEVIHPADSEDERRSQSEEPPDDSDKESDSDEPPDDSTPTSQFDPNAAKPTSPDNRRARRIQCPHCGIGLQLVDDTSLEVVCRGCGSSIPVDPGRTKTLGRLNRHQIGQFTLISILGEGAFGTVYKAKDNSLDRFVAIKLPRDGFFENSAQRQRFLREAQHAAQLSHTNIVTVHQVNEADGVPFIVSELIEGMTLADYCNSRQLEFRQSAEIMAIVCDAVNVAHSKNIIHRDLKPSNILLDRNLQPHVADFGLARQNEGEMTMTMAGEVLGTPAYMSPEQATGLNSNLKGTSDVYSLGVILYRLLTGSLPFRGSQRMLLHQVISEDPKSLRSFNDQIPRDLETITLEAMEKEPGKRFSSAADMGADLRRWLNGEPILTRPVSRTEKLIRWCRRKPAIASLIASIAALLVIACALAVLWGMEQRALAESMAESNTRLIRTFENEGERFLDENDLLRSLTWFSEAMHVDPSNDQRHRFRLGMILNQCPTLSQLSRVNGATTALAVSPDGEKIAVGDSNCLVTVFDAQTGVRIHSLREHQTSILFVRFAANSQKLISIGTDNFAVLWDVLTGQPTKLEHSDIVRHGQFSGNNTKVFTTSWDGTATLWDSATGRKLQDFSITDRRFLTCCISHDGAKVAARTLRYDEAGRMRGDNFEQWITVWDAETGLLEHDLPQPDQIQSLFFKQDGSELVIAQNDGKIRFVNPESGEEVRKSVELQQDLAGVSLLDSGSRLLTVTNNGNQSIWELGEEPVELFSRILGSGSVRRFALDRKQRLIASVHDDGSTHISFSQIDSSATCPLPNKAHIAFYPDGRRIATGDSSGVIRTWDLASTLTGQTHLLHNDKVKYIAASPDGSRIVTASQDGTARLWDSADGRAIGKPMQHDSSIFRVGFSSNGSRLLTVSTDGSARLWNVVTGTPVGEKYVRESFPVRMALHPELDQFATGTDAGEVAVWKEGNAQPLFTANHNERVWQIAYDPSGEKIAVGYTDGRLMLIDVDAKKDTQKTTHGEEHIQVVRFSNDGSLLVTGGNDNKVRIWNPAEFVEITEPLDHLSSVRWLDIRTDKTIAVADGSGRITLWQPTDSGWEKAWEQPLGGTGLDRIYFHPNERFVGVSGSATGLKNGSLGSGFALLFDMESQGPLSPRLRHFDRVEQIVFDPKGRFLATCSDDDTAIIWSLAPCELDIEHLRNLSVLFTSKFFDEKDLLDRLDAEQLESLFKEESKKYPESFRCTDQQILKWEKWIARVHANALAEEED